MSRSRGRYVGSGRRRYDRKWVRQAAAGHEVARDTEETHDGPPAQRVTPPPRLGAVASGHEQVRDDHRTGQKEPDGVQRVV